MKRKDVILKLLVIMLMCFITVSGCDTGSGNGTGNNSGNGSNNGTGNNGGKQGFLALARMDIEDANTVFIAANPVTSEDELYKITDSGSVEEVTYFDEGRKEISIHSAPSLIHNVGSDYIIVCYGLNKTNLDYGYLVRKIDGAVFSLSNAGMPYGQSNNFRNATDIQSDNKGNIYYITKAGSGYSGAINTTLRKVDISNPNILTAINYSPENDVPYYYFITPDSHAVYTYRGKDDISGSIAGTRIRKSNGGLVSLPSDALFWVGLSGKISYTDSGKIKNMSIADDGSVTEIEYSLNSITLPDSNHGGYLFKFTEKVILITSFSKIFELENTNNVPIEITIPNNIKEIKLASQSYQNYYLAGNNSSNKPVLIKVNPTDHSETILLQPDQYDVYSLSVSSDDIVSFAAISMSNGANIIGEISSFGNITILDTTLNTRVVVLERIR